MRRLLPILFVLILSLLARAQTLPATAPAAASQPATTQSTQPAATQPASQPASQPTPPAQTQPAATLPAGPSIPLAEIVTQSESTLAAVRTTTAQLTGDPLVATVANELPPLTRDIDARLEDPANDLSANPSLDTLRAAEAAWNTFAANTDVWKRDLTRRVAAIDNTLGDLQTRIDTWNNTLARANANRVPPEIIGRINTTLAALNDAHRQADAARANVLRLQALVAAQDARIAAALAEVARARDEALSHLFVQDSPPVWSTQVRPQAVAAATQPQDTFTKQRIALEIYFQQHSGRFLAHAFILALLTAALFWARRRFDTWVKDEPTLSPAAPVFASPLATAILLSVFLSIWLHPQAPRLFWAISGALTIIPAILLISRLTEPRLHRLLYVLVLFYFLDQLRAVIAGLYVWPRYFLLAETLAAVAFLVHFLFARLHAPPPPPPPSPAAPGAGPSVSAAPTLSRSARRRQTGLRLLLQFALLLCLASALVNLLGFLALATFIAHALFRAAYIALIFYAGISVLDGLVIVTLHIRPVHRLAAVKNHATTIRARTRRFLGWAFFLLWLYILLNILNLRAPVLNQLHFLLTTPFGLGPVTLGDILKGILTVWAAFAISRFIRFLLQEDVYPHVRLPRGLGAAFSSVIHYVILLFGFITALAFLGFPLSQLTILTGAFGVGLGFGLQTIINNFFSGLIVLFERPVQVGDVIEMDGLIGSITRIGIRASIIRTQAGSDIIMPNSRLVAEKVINWSLTDRCRGFEIPLVIDGAADTSRVIQILQDTAKKVPHIAANPAPVAQFTAFAGPNLRFTLRAWTSEVENWLQIQSNLGLALTAALTTEKIPLK
jgi:small-conductance mechanosensitive channel